MKLFLRFHQEVRSFWLWPGSRRAFGRGLEPSEQPQFKTGMISKPPCRAPVPISFVVASLSRNSPMSPAVPDPRAAAPHVAHDSPAGKLENQQLAHQPHRHIVEGRAGGVLRQAVQIQFLATGVWIAHDVAFHTIVVSQTLMGGFGVEDNGGQPHRLRDLPGPVVEKFSVGAQDGVFRGAERPEAGPAVWLGLRIFRHGHGFPFMHRDDADVVRSVPRALCGQARGAQKQQCGKEGTRFRFCHWGLPPCERSCGNYRTRPGPSKEESAIPELSCSRAGKSGAMSKFRNALAHQSVRSQLGACHFSGRRRKWWCVKRI